MLKRYKTSRQTIAFKYSLVEHFSEYKWFYFLFALVLLIGLIVGFVVGFNRADNFALKDLPDGVLACFVSKKMSGMAVFFSRLFAFLGLCLLILCLNSKGYLCWISFFIILYRAFLIGINSAILISLFKFGGVVNVVLLYFPVHLIITCLLVCFAVVCFVCCINQKNSGVTVFSGCFFQRHRLLILFVFLCAAICFLLEAIIMPHLTSALFVGVS